MRSEESSTEKHKAWKRNLIHDILASVYEPLRQVEENGINLLCPDGERRLIHPILAMYISDYQEQYLLACITFGCCPKCTIPAYHGKLELASTDSTSTTAPPAIKRRHTNETSKKKRKAIAATPAPKRIHVTQSDSGSETTVYGPRTEDDAHEIHERGDPAEMKAHGYKATMPFTHCLQYSSIYESIAPDLLHQASKLFYDDLHTWMLEVMAATHTDVGINKIKGEIDARFSQLPHIRSSDTFELAYQL